MRVLNERYELVEMVGQGGMGQVWRGRDRELARTVGVKTLPKEVSQQPEFRERFQREARAVAALAHPNITVLHDFGQDNDPDDPVPFLVMEFVDGRSLAQHLHDGPLPVPQAVAITHNIAGALAHSHRLGIVHRDVKPSNVMLTTTGAVKVLDFGIARMLADTATRLTATGRIVGTPSYMSPEQAMGEQVDERTDQYSLGCVLFELLTGKPPFTGDSVFSVMNQHLSRLPSAPSERQPDLPADLDKVVLRMLAKDPQERYPSMDAVSEALDPFVSAAASRTLTSMSRPVGGESASPLAPSAEAVGSALTIANPRQRVRNAAVSAEAAPEPEAARAEAPDSPAAPNRQDAAKASWSFRIPAAVGTAMAVVAVFAAWLMPWSDYDEEDYEYSSYSSTYYSYTETYTDLGVDTLLGQVVLALSLLIVVVLVVVLYSPKPRGVLMVGATLCGALVAVVTSVAAYQSEAKIGMYVAMGTGTAAAIAGVFAYRWAFPGKRHPLMPPRTSVSG